jgi:hypothetical protein
MIERGRDPGADRRILSAGHADFHLIQILDERRVIEC